MRGCVQAPAIQPESAVIVHSGSRGVAEQKRAAAKRCITRQLFARLAVGRNYRRVWRFIGTGRPVLSARSHARRIRSAVLVAGNMPRATLQRYSQDPA